MIVYNTTFHIDKGVLQEGLDYLKKVFIPKAVAGGVLLQPRLRRVIVVEPEDEGVSFAVQFHAKDLDVLKEWVAKEGKELHIALIRRFGSKVTGFTTLLEEIDWEGK